MVGDDESQETGSLDRHRSMLNADRRPDGESCVIAGQFVTKAPNRPFHADYPRRDPVARGDTRNAKRKTHSRSWWLIQAECPKPP